MPAHPPEDDDGHWVRRARAGDAGAFEHLVVRYQRRIFNLALRLLGSRADAEDATQEAFVRAFASLASFRGESRFGTWLYRVAVNACHDLLRRRQREHPGGTEPAPATPRGAAEASGPERVAERAEVRLLLERALAELPVEYRAAVVLRDLHDLSYEEIAHVLGVAVGTVKSRIHRGRRWLRLRLAEWELLPPGRVEPHEAAPVEPDEAGGGATAS